MAEGALARQAWITAIGTTHTSAYSDALRPEPAGSGDTRPLLLIADDERPVLQMLEKLGARLGFDVVTCEGGQAALRAMRERPADLALVDLRMPDLGGMDVLRQFRHEVPGCPVIIMTAYGAIDSAVEAMKLGAREYITKPFDFPALRQLLGEVRDELAQAPQSRPAASSGTSLPDLCGMLGDTPVIRRVSELTRSLATSTRVVFVSGERGTGKELVARAFHQHSERRDKPFVTINCAALVDSLFARELFGHEKGAFSGADAATPGLFEAAQGGTIFLDDVADLPLAVQGMLLQMLETGEITRVGAQDARAVDVAIVAATRHDLRSSVSSGRFRADLFYRLGIVGISLPPLRERTGDIPALARTFLREAPVNVGRRLSGFSDEAMRRLCEAPWEGNVRELRAAIERAAARATGPLVTADDLLLSSPGESLASGARSTGLHVVRSGATRAPLHDVEKEHILSVLRDVRGNRVVAARVLGISRRALYRRLARHRIAAESLHAVPARRSDPVHPAGAGPEAADSYTDE